MPIFEPKIKLIESLLNLVPADDGPCVDPEGAALALAELVLEPLARPLALARLGQRERLVAVSVRLQHHRLRHRRLKGEKKE